MKFSEALEAMMKGEIITRNTPCDTKGEIRTFKYDEYYCSFYYKSNLEPCWTRYEFSSLELLVSNWEIAEKELKLHTSEEAIQALKEGKKIKRIGWSFGLLLDLREFSIDKYITITVEDLLANDWVITEARITPFDIDDYGIIRKK